MHTNIGICFHSLVDGVSGNITPPRFRTSDSAMPKLLVSPWGRSSAPLWGNIFLRCLLIFAEVSGGPLISPALIRSILGSVEELARCSWAFVK
jgi:hypothetical protein